MILVVGGTGQVGRMIVGGLIDRGEAVRILVRPDTDAAGLVAAGAIPVVGDLKQPDTLVAACRGVDAVVTTANAASPRLPEDTPETVDDLGNAALFSAASAAGVRQVVYVSASLADADSPVPFLRAKGRAESHLVASGVPFTILRPDAFMEVWAALVVGMPAAMGRAVRLPLPPVRRHSLISAADVAAYAVAMTGDPRALGRRFDLGGPEPLTWSDVAAAYARVLGRPVPVEVVGPDGDLAPLGPMEVGLLCGMEMADSILDPSAVAAEFDVTPTPLEAVIRGSVPVPV